MLDRRRLVLAGVAAVLRPASARSRLETLSDWLTAHRKDREAGLHSCLERIQAADSSIRAWVQVLPEEPTGDGKLTGIPFGAKDIIETRGLATEYGSPVYQGRKGTADAAIIQELRGRGAVLLGKTQTAAFAMRDPSPTRNPWNLEHTPGGSSSGSAAAVAAGMVPFAIGTQTSGSTIKPASYCGVTGFKPSFALLSLDGVLPYAKSLDTLGFFTHTPADMLLLWEAMGHPTGQGEDIPLGIPEPMPKVEPEMTVRFQDAIASLRKAGISCQPVDISSMLAQVDAAQHTVAFYEGARFHQQRFNEYGDRLGYLAGLVREGLQIPEGRYDDARRVISDNRMRMTELYKATPVILVPAATGEAPFGLSYTGDSRMNTPWTALGTPAISVPMPVGDGLPLGLQLTSAPGREAQVLRTAVGVHRILNRKKQTPARSLFRG